MTRLTYALLLIYAALCYTQDDRFEPSRTGLIVSVMPSSTDLIYAAGRQDDLVGVTSYCNAPGKAVIGDIVVDAEKVLTLRAEFVAGQQSTNARTLEHLQRLGLTVIPTDNNSFEEMAGVLRRLGGDRAADELLARVARVKPGPPLSVYYESTFEPILVPGPGSYVDHVIRRAGGRNIFADMPEPWLEVPWELVLARDPDVLLIAHDRIEQVRARPGWGELHGQVHVVNFEDYVLPTPRLVNGLEQLAEILRGAATP